MMAPLVAVLAVASGVMAAEVEALGLPTPAWHVAGGLLLRADPESLEGLLLAHSVSPVVYRYLPEQRRLATVDRRVWDRAPGATANCSAFSDPDPTRFRIDPRRGVLLAGERLVETAGAVAVGFARSPSGAWIAVASARGPRAGALLPFLGGAGASGPHYHQVLRASDNAPAEPAVRIPFESSRQVLSLCWSRDERYVVYHDYFFTQAVIVPFRGVSGKER